MTNRFTPIAELPQLSLLLHARLAAVKMLANSARFQGYVVACDFDGLAAELEHELRLEIVRFNEPGCLLTGYNIIRPKEGSLNRFVSVNYLHTVKYSFTGSEELFRYCPDHFINRSGLVCRPYEHKLQFDAELKGINCWHAEQLAAESLRDTFALVELANEMVKAWLPILQQKINNEVAQICSRYAPLRRIG